MIFQKPTENMHTEVWVKINGSDILVGSVDQMHDFYSSEIRLLEKIAAQMIAKAPKKVIIQLNMSDAKLDKKSKIMSFHYDGGSWPDELSITSHITGVVVKFNRATIDHPLHDQDSWDGEGALYVADAKDTQWCAMLWIG
jgi:hypothetical protein